MKERTDKEGTVAEALINEAIAVLKLTKSREEARATLEAGVSRYPLMNWEKIAIGNYYMIQEKKYIYKNPNTDSLGQIPRWIK